MAHANESFRIVGTGICVPDRILTNEEIRSDYNPYINPDWVDRTLGIKERRIASKDVKTSDMAASAATKALKHAGVLPTSVDLLIVATATPDQQAPATACITQHKAGLANAVAFDVSAVCSGFLFGLTAAASFLATGRCKRALVVGADAFSRVTDWSRRDCPFFGDGAGAALLERSSISQSGDRLFDAELHADGSRAEAFVIEDSTATFVMDGPTVFKAASEVVPRCIHRLMKRNGLGACDIDIVIPHQPSISLLRNIARQAGIPFEKFRTNMDRYANTAGATIPIVLHEAVVNSDFKPGDIVMFAAAGAGFTAGAAIHRWH